MQTTGPTTPSARPSDPHRWPGCRCESCFEAYVSPSTVVRVARVVLAVGLVVLLGLVAW